MTNRSILQFAVMVLGFLTAAPGLASNSLSKLGPPDKIDALSAQGAGVFPFIVRGNDKGLSAARSLAIQDAEIASPVELPLIDGLALALREKDAETLSQRPDIFQVWYINKRLFSQYVNVIQGFQYTLKTVPTPSILNLSLGPPADLMPIAAYDEEPMNDATRKMADFGFITVFAIGNYFNPDAPNRGVVNPWCRPVWVICVGAASADAKNLYSQSARGVKSDPTTWPDLVANGIDVIGPRASNGQKTESQKQYDESNTQFLKLIPPNKRDMYTLMSGTSQATAHVSRAASQIIFFVLNVVESLKNPPPGSPIFSMTIPRDRLDFVSRHQKRLTGDLGRESSAGVEITYRWVEPWRLVKQLLIDTALPMPGFEPEDVGAGFVSPNYIQEQFGKYGPVEAGIVGIKIFP